jgi:phosphohistidine phosphatase
MVVLIFRHGIAIPRDEVEGIPDAERPLTERGVKRTRAAARGLVALDHDPDALYTSPYVRARQTAELAVLALGRSAPLLTITDSLLPGSDPALLLEELRGAGVERPLCVGHAPHLDLLVAHLLDVSTPITRLGKAGLAVVEVADHGPVGGNLVGLYRPGDLRSLG